MTNTDTPRPRADEIRALVAEAQKDRDWLAYSGDGAADIIGDLIAAVESLLEDRELLDGLERCVCGRGIVHLDWQETEPAAYSAAVSEMEGDKGDVYRGRTLRAALKQAVGG